MNVTAPHWANFFPKASNPLTSVLAVSFAIPRDVPPPLQSLLDRLERRRRMH